MGESYRSAFSTATLRPIRPRGTLPRVNEPAETPDRRVFDEIAALATEQRNPRTTNLDRLPVKDILAVINSEDRLVAGNVRSEIPFIAEIVELTVAAIKRGGRIIYIGAGTSGRLGVLDAAECPPTFGTPPEMVVGIIAGGDTALRRAVEGAEDREEEGRRAIRDAGVGEKDVVIGLAASRRTPYVVAALAEARSLAARTALICCAPREEVAIPVDVAVCLRVGPEAVMGSTRMKAGSAQKMTLNLISTATMIRLGKLYQNMMVDLMATSRKLVERSRRTVMTVTGIGFKEACKVLDDAGGSVKTAIVMVRGEVSREVAEEKLERADGLVRIALGEDGEQG
jgi:N-acetylmuramic acid 6-phosphate etherase